MDPTLQYAVLAAVGVISGVGIHRLSASVRGSMKKRIIVIRLLEGVAAAPGIGLAVLFLAERQAPSSLFHMLGFMGAFLVPYVGTRIATYLVSVSRDEGALPFAHWFDLLRTDPAAAREFLTAYLAQYHQRQAELLPALHVGCAFLAQRHGADPLLPAALDTLRSEIALLQGARSPSGTGRLP